MARLYSKAQAMYLNAKSVYQSAVKCHEDALVQRDFYVLLDTADDDTLAGIECAAQAVSHMDEALDTYLKTERELFSWGQAQALHARRAKTQKDEAALLKHMFANIQKYPHLKEKLAGICLALEYEVKA